jgi:hypothetical protein
MMACPLLSPKALIWQRQVRPVKFGASNEVHFSGVERSSSTGGSRTFDVQTPIPKFRLKSDLC